MNIRPSIQLFIGLMVAALASSANATLNYFDADITSGSSSSNTTLGGSPLSDTNLGSWSLRGASATINDGSAEAAGRNFALGGSVISSGNGSTSIEELTTTVPVSSAMGHDVYVFFWTPVFSYTSWDIEAGLTPGMLSQFNDSSAMRVDAAFISSIGGFSPGIQGLILGDANDPLDDFTDFADGNRALYAANLGTVPAGATSIDVFVNAGTQSGERTWYDGVGIVPVPEPSSLLILAFGLCGLVALRKRS